MGSERKRTKPGTDPIEIYRRIRKPMPPPQKVLPDERRKLDEERARKEIEEGSR